uniref:Uncharacterized protein n=1 Tax=Panagrolaimus sp. JU765 TaxID=591449 RepID=A0AC34R9K3_9BILA
TDKIININCTVGILYGYLDETEIARVKDFNHF